MIKGVRIFFFQAEDGIRDVAVTGVQTCALPISPGRSGILHGRLDLRPVALAVSAPPGARLPDRLRLACPASHGPGGRARDPPRHRVPRAGARAVRGRRLPAVPDLVLAGCRGWGSPDPLLGPRDTCPAAY